MTWNYRIVKYYRGDGYGLHEVFYDEDGLPWSMTESPIGFSCGEDEGPDGVRSSLELALADAKTRPVLDEPERGKWPGKAPGIDEPNDKFER